MARFMVEITEKDHYVITVEADDVESAIEEAFGCRNSWRYSHGDGFEVKATEMEDDK